MRVTVRLFASLRDALGNDSFVEEFAEGGEGAPVTVATLRERLGESHPALRPHLERVAVAVNEEYALDPETTLSDGDTVALIPPISGGAETPAFLVTRDVLDAAALREAVTTPESGAVVVFEGIVRNHHEGRDVIRLEYEAYEPMAERQLRAVAEEVLAYANQEVSHARDGVHAIGIHHRFGMLEVGDTSLLVVVAAGHRQIAFEAGLRTVDRVKETVPVWKREWGPDGSHWQEGVQPKPVE